MQIAKRYHATNKVTLLHGDCLRLLQQIPTGSAKLVLTSPPYNLGKSYERQKTLEEYLHNQRQVIAECVRVTAQGGSICWQVGHHVNGHAQVIPLDILLHPLFAEHETTAAIRLRNRIQLAIHTISPTVISGVCRSPSAGMSAHSRWTILMVKNETVA
jgi:adenine-specific DNA-methyltransferase